MLKHAIVFIAIQVVFKAIKSSSALQLRDISSFIENLQRNEEKYNGAKVYPSEVNENKGRIAISSRELEDIINQVAKSIYNKHKYIYEYKDQMKNLKKLENYEFRNMQNRNLQQSLNRQRGHRKPSKAVLSSLALNSVDIESDNGKIINDNDYKLYLILNPQANLNKNDFKDITGLLSQIITGSVSDKIYPKQDNARIKKEPRYKGFITADGRRARRRNRESKEMYSLQNSLEDFKPKRARSEYGGAGGRTPIPYIGHRDIYERE